MALSKESETSLEMAIPRSANDGQQYISSIPNMYN